MPANEALTRLVQKTFDAVAQMSGNLQTLVAQQAEAEKHRSTQDARLTKMEGDVISLRVELAALKASRMIMGGGAALGGSGLGYLLSLLAK